MIELATKAALLALRSDLQAAVALLDAKSDNLSLRLTVRLGAMLAAGIAALAALMKLG